MLTVLLPSRTIGRTKMVYNKNANKFHKNQFFNMALKYIYLNCMLDILQLLTIIRMTAADKTIAPNYSSIECV